MTDPASSTTAVAVSTVALAAVFPGIPVNVVLGAFAGSVLFVVTSNDFSFGKKLFLFFGSFVAGFLGSDITAQIMEMAEGVNNVDRGVGALVTSAVAVRALLSLFHFLDDPQLPFLPKRKRPTDDGEG